MKRGTDGEKMVPMFPRLHVNDTEKGGPRAPPRNKMALYEQLSTSSRRFRNGVDDKPRCSAVGSLRQSSQGVANEMDKFRPYQLPDGYQSEKQYRQYPEPNYSLTQVKQRKKLDEDDFRVPVFVDSIPSQKSSKYQISSTMDIRECSRRQEGEIQKKRNSKEFATGHSNSLFLEQTECQRKKTDSPMDRESGDNLTNSIQKVASFVDHEPTLCSKAQAADERHTDNSLGSCEDVPCRSMQTRNAEKGDSVSGYSGVNSVLSMDITPDDVVELIGQRRFWRARRSLANQQRVFAIQVFELHRLIKIQKLMAGSSSSHLVHNYPAEKATHSSRGKENCNVQSTLDVSQQNDQPKSPDRDNENSAGNVSIPNTPPWCFNQLYGQQQWLIPVMSPFEGLIYKPYSGQDCGPHNHVQSNFANPHYTIGAPHPFFNLPSFPSACPLIGMPIMNPHAFSGSSIEQQTVSWPGQANATVGILKPQVSNESSVGNANREMAKPIEVIKVVPHNATSATESAARIFSCIQEERKRLG